MSLPETTAKPCRECPWRKVSTAGWLGPYGPADWIAIAQSETAIACHLTIADEVEGGDSAWDHPSTRQCAGAASFRQHLCKSPRNRELAVGPERREEVFESPMEFLNHHLPEGVTAQKGGEMVVEAAFALAGMKVPQP